MFQPYAPLGYEQAKHHQQQLQAHSIHKPRTITWAHRVRLRIADWLIVSGEKLKADLPTSPLLFDLLNDAAQ